MVIWRGNGIAIAGVIFGTALVANFIADKFGGPNYWDTHGWPLACSLAIDSLILVSIDRFLSEREARIVLERASRGEPYVSKPNDLFYLGYLVWSLIAAILAAIIMLFRWSPGPS